MKEENDQGDLSDGETVKVRYPPSSRFQSHTIRSHLPPPLSRLPHLAFPCILFLIPSQATVKVDYGPRKLVTLTFFYPSQAASRKLDSPLAQGTEV